jgi:hypothetical protein
MPVMILASGDGVERGFFLDGGRVECSRWATLWSLGVLQAVSLFIAIIFMFVAVALTAL